MSETDLSILTKQYLDHRIPNLPTSNLKRRMCAFVSTFFDWQRASMEEEMKSSPTVQPWLAANLQNLNFAGPAALALLENFWADLGDDRARLAVAKELIHYFTKSPEKARLLCGSRYYLTPARSCPAILLIYIAANYVLGQADRCVDAAESLAAIWPNTLTKVILGRVLEETAGPGAERQVLEEAVRHSDDLVVRLNLIEIVR